MNNLLKKDDLPKRLLRAGGEVSRRRLFESAALMVGGAAVSAVAGEAALARTSEVTMDPSGRVIVGCTIYGRESTPTELPGARAEDLQAERVAAVKHAVQT